MRAVGVELPHASSGAFIGSREVIYETTSPYFDQSISKTELSGKKINTNDT
jgi:hypothetical protein